MLIPFLSKFVFLGHGLFIAPPKPFSVCFLFKYCISHQKASQQSLSPGLISATGNRDAAQTQGGSRWGGGKKEAGGWAGRQREHLMSSVLGHEALHRDGFLEFT